MSSRPVSAIQHIISCLHAHAHVCGHESCGDIKMLLDGDKQWNRDFQQIISSLVERCNDRVA